MTYIVKQKIHGKLYAYEVKGYWDSKKKQARQKRRYLGVWDEKTGSVKQKESERDVRTTKSYGPAYLLDRVSSELKLKQQLAASFGEDGASILALAMSKVIHPSALKHISHTMDDTMIGEVCGLTDELSSQRLSELLERIALNEKGMDSFHRKLVSPEDKKAMIYDITSLGSYSENISWFEYGDDYKKLDLAQVNLGVVMSVERKIPIYHKLFPGSVNDVVTLKNLITEVKQLGIQRGLFVLDRGFYSESNVEEMCKEEIEFVMPLPFSVKIGKESISETNIDIEDARYARRYDKEILHVIKKDLEVGKQKLRAFILFSPKRKADEISSFYNRLMDIEAKLEGHRTFENAYDHFKRVAGDFQRFFEVKIDNRTIHLERKSKAISQASNRMGKMILLTTLQMTWNETLAIYRERDSIEKVYDDLKNDLDVMPLRVRKVETLKGLIFIYFIAMILRSILLQNLLKTTLSDKFSIEDILLDLGKLRAVHIGNSWKLTEITKRQRIIFEKLLIPVPIDVACMNLVIKNSGV